MRRVCIFASFWRTPDLPPYILFHLDALAAQGFETVLVSNSPIGNACKARLASCCTSVIERENAGFDFGAWRDALKTIDLSDVEGLLLTNSSIVGPLSDLEPVFAEMDSRPCDFWGLTYNRLFVPHLQSFFLYFRPQVFRSAAWTEFWKGVQNFTNKAHTIENYELGLTKFFTDRGFECDSYIKPNPLWTILQVTKLSLHRRKTVYFDDPTIARAVEIVREGFPYVKASLLWGDAMGLGPPLSRFRKEFTDYDWAMLDAAIAR